MSDRGRVFDPVERVFVTTRMHLGNVKLPKLLHQFLKRRFTLTLEQIL